MQGSAPLWTGPCRFQLRRLLLPLPAGVRVLLRGFAGTVAIAMISALAAPLVRAGDVFRAAALRFAAFRATATPVIAAAVSAAVPAAAVAAALTTRRSDFFAEIVRGEREPPFFAVVLFAVLRFAAVFRPLPRLAVAEDLRDFPAALRPAPLVVLVDARFAVVFRLPVPVVDDLRDFAGDLLVVDDLRDFAGDLLVDLDEVRFAVVLRPFVPAEDLRGAAADLRLVLRAVVDFGEEVRFFAAVVLPVEPDDVRFFAAAFRAVLRVPVALVERLPAADLRPVALRFVAADFRDEVFEPAAEADFLPDLLADVRLLVPEELFAALLFLVPELFFDAPVPELVDLPADLLEAFLPPVFDPLDPVDFREEDLRAPAADDFRPPDREPRDTNFEKRLSPSSW